MTSGIVFFLLFILPFVIAPFGITQFENPKVIFSEAGVLLLLLVFIFTNKINFKLAKQQYFIYGTIIFLTIIDLLFLKTSISFFGNAFRMQGIFLLWILLLFSLLSSPFSFKKIPWFVYAIFLFIESIAMLFLSTNESNRFIGTLGEPNALAAFAIFTFPFVFYSIKKFLLKEKLGLGFSIFLVLLILFASGSKSAVIAFAIELVYIFLTKTSLSKIKVVGICLVLYFLSYIFPYISQNPYENRVEVWRSATSAGFMKPIFGWGFGNTEIALKKSAKIVDLPIQYYYVDSSHNIFLDWFVQGGFIGLLAFVSLVAFTLYSFIKTDNNLYLSLFLGLITTLSFNPASVVGLLGFWFLIGKGFSLLPSSHEAGVRGKDV